jgi:hypothetical protein
MTEKNKPQMDAKRSDSNTGKHRPKKNKPRINTNKHKSELKPRTHPAPARRSGTSSDKHRRKKPILVLSLDDIVNDFGDRVMRGETLAIDDILKQYPKHADKLKPLLEAEMVLIKAGQEYRKRTEKAFAGFKEELWAKLEKMILEKQKKQIEERVALAKQKSSLPIELRAEFIPILLYIKGRTSRIGEGIRGITRFIKVLFLIDKETDYSKLVKVFYSFVPYKIGPFEPAIYQDLQVLEMAGIVKKQTYTYKIPTSEKEIDEGFNHNNQSTLYTLTDEGMKYAKALIDWLDKKDPDISMNLRRYKTYSQMPLKYLLKYIYEKYPKYTTESEVIEEVLK